MNGTGKKKHLNLFLPYEMKEPLDVQEEEGPKKDVQEEVGKEK